MHVLDVTFPQAGVACLNFAISVNSYKYLARKAFSWHVLFQIVDYTLVFFQWENSVNKVAHWDQIVHVVANCYIQLKMSFMEIL